MDKQPDGCLFRNAGAARQCEEYALVIPRGMTMRATFSPRPGASLSYPNPVSSTLGKSPSSWSYPRGIPEGPLRGSVPLTNPTASADSRRQIGGTPVSTVTYPWVATLLACPTGPSSCFRLCTGSLISHGEWLVMKCAFQTLDRLL